MEIEVRKPDPNREGWELATEDRIYEWGRLRLALLKLGFKPCKYNPNNKVYLYPGEIAVKYNNYAYLIMMKDDISKVLKSLPLDTKGSINKMKYKKEQRENQSQ